MSTSSIPVRAPRPSPSAAAVEAPLSPASSAGPASPVVSRLPQPHRASTLPTPASTAPTTPITAKRSLPRNRRLSNVTSISAPSRSPSRLSSNIAEAVAAAAENANANAKGNHVEIPFSGHSSRSNCLACQLKRDHERVLREANPYRRHKMALAGDSPPEHQKSSLPIKVPRYSSKSDSELPTRRQQHRDHGDGSDGGSTPPRQRSIVFANVTSRINSGLVRSPAGKIVVKSPSVGNLAGSRDGSPGSPNIIGSSRLPIGLPRPNRMSGSFSGRSLSSLASPSSSSRSSSPAASPKTALPRPLKRSTLKKSVGSVNFKDEEKVDETGRNVLRGGGGGGEDADDEDEEVGARPKSRSSVEALMAAVEEVETPEKAVGKVDMEEATVTDEVTDEGAIAAATQQVAMTEREAETDVAGIADVAVAADDAVADEDRMVARQEGVGVEEKGAEEVVAEVTNEPAECAVEKPEMLREVQEAEEARSANAAIDGKAVKEEDAEAARSAVVAGAEEDTLTPSLPLTDPQGMPPMPAHLAADPTAFSDTASYLSYDSDTTSFTPASVTGTGSGPATAGVRAFRQPRRRRRQIDMTDLTGLATLATARLNDLRAIHPALRASAPSLTSSPAAAAPAHSLKRSYISAAKEIVVLGRGIATSWAPLAKACEDPRLRSALLASLTECETLASRMKVLVRLRERGGESDVDGEGVVLRAAAEVVRCAGECVRDLEAARVRLEGYEEVVGKVEVEEEDGEEGAGAGMTVAGKGEREAGSGMEDVVRAAMQAGEKVAARRTAKLYYVGSKLYASPGYLKKA
ncbi:hypothetical protein HK101_008097 [Irineochytrium annulatum]|nr:hypothetical protein HK101_008097 [Irineochytrium annulatum]